MCGSNHCFTIFIDKILQLMIHVRFNKQITTFFTNQTLIGNLRIIVNPHNKLIIRKRKMDMSNCLKMSM